MTQHNILAVVFDPNIEEALICKHIRCTEEVMAELKGPHACNHIMHIATIQQKVETIYMSLLSQTA